MDRLYAPVRHKGQDALLMLDTGAAMSFLHMGVKAARYTPKAGSVEIGGYTLELAGRSIIFDGAASKMRLEPPGPRACK